ncbi:MAG: sigma-70 family RNA polymerase sigma factor [Planctomycetes bacterium]|nr:sigma-70 family RNA polymerase sigma factor [Planctomycetota bacterium]
MARARSGEAGAFEELVVRHAGLVASIAYGVLGDFHLARDVVQEVFIKVYRRLGELREPDSLASWLHGVARTTALDQLRGSRRALAQAGIAEEAALEAAAAPEGDGPLRETQRRELTQRVRAEVDRLPEAYREVVALKYLEGLPYTEIAKVLGTTEAAVESRLHRARALLRDALKAWQPGG